MLKDRLNFKKLACKVKKETIYIYITIFLICIILTLFNMKLQNVNLFKISLLSLEQKELLVLSILIIILCSVFIGLLVELLNTIKELSKTKFKKRGKVR